MGAWPTSKPPRRLIARPSPEALLVQAEAGGPRPAEDFPRRRARGRQDLRDAGGGAGPAPRRRRRRRRRRRNPWPQGNRGAAGGPRGRAAAQHRLQGPRHRGNGSRRHPGARARSWCWSTNSRTPTRPASAIPSAIWTSRNCWSPASTSTPRSTSSTSKASTTWWRRSPASACARPCPTACSTAPTTSR